MSFKRGGVLVMTLVFVTMFLVIFTGLVGVVSRTYHQAVIQAQDELAFQVAEAGLDYGRWRLAHSPEDFTAEMHEVVDQTGTLGTYDVMFVPQASSSLVVIESVGRTESLPSREVTLRARYGMPSLAQYASLTNGDVWYGGEIDGPVHANGGIRMDGSSDSLMTSARETYVCQPQHGCSYEVKPGIWGSGEIQDLWEFPVPVVDYNSITLDLLDMKSIAQTAGHYYGPGAGAFGYHLVFNADNTYSVYRVTKKTPQRWSWFPETDWQRASYDISEETLLEARDVPSDGVIYVEDTVWVEGDIRDRVSVVAGRFPDVPATNLDIIINGDISYGGVKDGTRSFGAVAQRHVLIPYSGAPDNLQLDGAFVAQKGRFGRHYYSSGEHILKTSIVRYGMVASNLWPVTAWVDGGGQVTSGYQQGSSSYDSNLVYLPPPYFPTTGQHKFISWEEVE